MNNTLLEYRKTDSSYYGDAVEDSFEEDSRKGSHPSDVGSAKTEQGDHHSTAVDDNISLISMDESKSALDNFPDIASAVENEDDERTLSASLCSSKYEANAKRDSSPTHSALNPRSAWSEESQTARVDCKESSSRKKSSVPRSTSSSVINPSARKASRNQAPASARKRAPKCRQSIASSRSFSPLSSSTSASCLYYSSSNKDGSKDTDRTESEVGIAELSEALRQLSRDARFRSIRPLWRDPNSRPLPSDETASVAAMLREYNNLLNAANNCASAPCVSPQLTVRRPYHSTLNRWRQQERIQMENFFLANRLRNIRPSPEISREVLLKRYKQYFITPISAQNLCNRTTSDVDISSLRNRLRCSSARSVHQESSRARRPLTSAASGRSSDLAVPPPPRPPACECDSASRRSSGQTPHSREVLDSLNSVRRALHEQRTRGKF